MTTIIVGGGCAGLAAAHTMTKHGAEVLILEKEADPGGRMRTYKQDGFLMDMGAQYVHPGYKVARELMADVGMIGELGDIPMNNIQMFRDGKWYYPQPYGSTMERLRTQRWRTKFGVNGLRGLQRMTDFVLARAPQIYEGSVDWFMDMESEWFGDFVKREYGSEVLEYFVQPVISAITFAEPEDIGMGFGLQIMWTILCGRAAVPKRGIGSLAEALVAEAAANNIAIKGGTPVEQIVIEKGKVKGVTTPDGFIDADTVICATTATKALSIMPDLPDTLRGPLSRVTYTPIVNAMVAVDKLMSAEGSAGGVLPRRAAIPISFIGFNSARSRGLAPDGCDSINCFIYGKHAYTMFDKSDEEITRRMVAYLQELVPRMPKKILFSKIARWTEANYLMAPGTCAAVKNMRDNHYRDVEGLFLCGEYMYTGAYESALAAGQAAAQAALGMRESI